MIAIVKKELNLLQFTNLAGFPGLIHFSTIRTGGCSTGTYKSFNLGYNSGDLPECVTANRFKLCTSLEINPERLIFPKQTHSATARTIDAGFFAMNPEDRKKLLNQTDALITNLRGVCIAIKTADCVPVLLYDPKQEVVAAIHAGWRGTAAKIIGVTISKMTEEFGSDPADMRAGIGPSVSPEIYEVGEEVWQQFNPRFYHAIEKSKPDKRQLDIRKANYHELCLSGIPPGQIEDAQICTFSDPERFFSARRDGQKTGRMATGIMITKSR